MKIKSAYIIFLLIILFSCTHTFQVKVTPDDASLFINGLSVENNKKIKLDNDSINILCRKKGYKEYRAVIKNQKIIGVNEVVINLELEDYFINIKTINGSSNIIIDSIELGATPKKLKLKHGTYDIVLKRKGYPLQRCRIEANSSCSIILKHQKNEMSIKQVGIFKCGSQPKQVLFTPDDKKIYIPLLDGDGFEVFDMETKRIEERIIPPKYNKKTGFPEGLFIEDKNVFWVSQMTTGKIFEYTYPELEYKRTISTGGIWSKFMAWSDELQLAAVSNWTSDDISIINYSDGKIIKKINTASAPRGLIFSNDSKFLFATSFEGGKIYKIKTKDWKIEKSIYKQNACMRHILLTSDNKKAYVSNMRHNEIYEIDTGDFKIKHTYDVDYNPNTIDISSNDRFLFVSSRGPNAEEGYLTRSPRNGKIAIIDLFKKEVISYIEGGNQPTGLDISNDNNYLCFSNFRDNNIELYWIGDLVNETK